MPCHWIWLICLVASSGFLGLVITRSDAVGCGVHVKANQTGSDRALSPRQDGSRPIIYVKALPSNQATDNRKRVNECRSNGGILIRIGTAKYVCIKSGSGRSFKDCNVCPEMVVVPAGSFIMGSPNGERERKTDEAQVKASVAKPFAVGKFEVTFAEWDSCVAAGGCKHKPGDMGFGRERRPVINVSWNDIEEQYLPWLRRRSGKYYRLLTEREWEYVARARTTTAYHWGSEFDPTKANNKSRTVRVGSFHPNAFGLYDVHGNVWEWVQDCYLLRSQVPAVNHDSGTTDKCKKRVLRGGGWNNLPRTLRSAFRYWGYPSNRNDSFGFRVARKLMR